MDTPVSTASNGYVDGVQRVAESAEDDGIEPTFDGPALEQENKFQKAIAAWRSKPSPFSIPI